MEIEKIEKIKELAIEGLYTDGAHHKQWYLEEILKFTGANIEELRKSDEYGGWDDGIAP